MNSNDPICLALTKSGWDVGPDDRIRELTYKHSRVISHSELHSDSKILLVREGDILDALGAEKQSSVPDPKEMALEVSRREGMPLLVLDDNSLIDLEKNPAAPVESMLYANGEEHGFSHPVAKWLSQLNAILGRKDVSDQKQNATLQGFDKVELVMDHPSEADHLGRQGLAEALAQRLVRIQESNANIDVASSFMVHLQGAWGSGKTSLLNLVADALHKITKKKGENKECVVIRFNAWQQQHTRPPWWPLHEKVYQQALAQVTARSGTDRLRAWSIRLKELWWRLAADRMHYLITAAILLAALAVISRTVLLPLADKHPNLEEIAKWAQSLSTIGTFLTTAVSLILLFTRSLTAGSAEAVQTFIGKSRDPLTRLSEHFRSLARSIRVPIFVFIDDMDRCDRDYTVGILEGIQTLFHTPRVVWVVAGDRNWIWKCFELKYHDFALLESTPGRPLGYLFLEKLFQLSVEIPPISPEVKKAYWAELLAGDVSQIQGKLKEFRADLDKEFKELRDQDQILKAANQQEDSVFKSQARRDAAVARLAAEDIEVGTMHFLQHFVHLLDPNPRGMKRLINAYGMTQAAMIASGIALEGEETKRAQLVLWTILRLRWPTLAAHLAESPEAVDAIGEDVSSNRDIPQELWPLFRNSEVRALFDLSMSGVQAALDQKAVNLFTRLYSE